jgi:hypothetical protein
VDRAHAYLGGALTAPGAHSVIGLDARFEQTLEPRALRSLVRERTGVDIGFDAGDEAFSSMMALKLCGWVPATRAAVSRSASLVRGQEFRGRYRFFRVPSGFASDTDCTALAAAGLYETGRLSTVNLCASAEELLRAAAPASVPASQNLDEATGKSRGDLHARVVMVSWDEEEGRGAGARGREHDAAVAANVLYTMKLAQEMGLEDPRGIIAATLTYVRDHLRSGAWQAGTRCYPSPDTFLYCVACLCRRFPECRASLGVDLHEALAVRAESPARFGGADEPWSLLNVAQRVIAACHLGTGASASEEARELASYQDPDGSWPAAPFYALGERPLYFGSRVITTMFVARAIGEYRRVGANEAPSKAGAGEVAAERA